MPKKLIKSFGGSISSSNGTPAIATPTTTTTTPTTAVRTSTSTSNSASTSEPATAVPQPHHHLHYHNHHHLPHHLAALVPPALLTPDPLPRLVVFDLDYTLWPFWVDTHPTPPVKPIPNSLHTATTTSNSGGATSIMMADRHGETYAFYDDVPSILWILPRLGVRVGVASRTHAPDLAREMLKYMVITPPPVPSADDAPAAQQSKRDLKPRKALDLFDAGVEIYPGTKIPHMQALARRNGVPFEDILFFDDESRNREVEGLGVTMQLVPSGVSWKEVERGVEEWRRRRDV